MPLTPAAVSEFASKPFVRSALNNPSHPRSVLSFFFGIDCALPTASDALRDCDVLDQMRPFWFRGHGDYDKLCQSFANAIRAAGKEELPTSPLPDGAVWDSVDGKMARVILTDQLSRNCFRGNDEAYMYDDVAIVLARELAGMALTQNDGEVESGSEPKQEIYITYAAILSLALSHSEDTSDHATSVSLVEWAQSTSPRAAEKLEVYRTFALKHKAILDRFGRFPHRNVKKGRESTDEEKTWLASDECPDWAKSQG